MVVISILVHLFFQIQNSQCDIGTATTEAYITSQLTAFGFPQSYETLTTTASPSADGITITVDFGAISAGRNSGFLHLVRITAVIIFSICKITFQRPVQWQFKAEL
jgi:hypothetical protein